MRTGKIVELRCVYRDEDKNVQGGVNFYLPENSRIVMIQTWEHTASGEIWGQVQPDPIGSDQGLLEYFLEAWQDRKENPWTGGLIHYEVEDVDGNYC